jgi:hypothetical protein
MRYAWAFAVILGCDTRAPAPPTSAPAAPAASAAPAAPSASIATAAEPGAPTATEVDAGTVPLASPSPLVALAVPPFRDAVVSLPLGATTPRPLVIASHGNYDRPEWQCSTWRDIVGDCAFVLCPRGVPRTDSPGPDDVRFTYDGAAPLAREIEAGLTALRARFGAYIDEGPVLYTGFSLGAILGVPFVTRDPARYTRAVLIEGGHSAWTAAAAKQFRAHGGERVLFACGQPSCVGDAKAASARLAKTGAATRVVLGPGVGHGYTGPVATAVKNELAWLLEGDERCAHPAP